MISVENLKKLDRQQLIELAAKHNVPTYWNSKEETIIKNIIDSVLNPIPATPQVLQENAKSQETPEHHNTPTDVEIAIAAIKQAQPAFTAEYNLEENTWHFKCLGAEESGNLDIPLKIIKRQAQQVAKGRRALLHRPEFQSMTSSGNNAYTNVVLS